MYFNREASRFIDMHLLYVSWGAFFLLHNCGCNFRKTRTTYNNITIPTKRTLTATHPHTRKHLHDREFSIFNQLKHFLYHFIHRFGQ